MGEGETFGISEGDKQGQCGRICCMLIEGQEGIIDATP
jgi:hypothetical protein